MQVKERLARRVTHYNPSTVVFGFPTLTTREIPSRISGESLIACEKRPGRESHKRKSPARSCSAAERDSLSSGVRVRASQCNPFPGLDSLSIACFSRDLHLRKKFETRDLCIRGGGGQGGWNECPGPQAPRQHGQTGKIRAQETWFGEVPKGPLQLVVSRANGFGSS